MTASEPKSQVTRHTSQVRRVLVLSVSAGAGHVRAAQAIVAHANADFNMLDVHHVDMLTLVPGWFRKIYSDLYLKLARDDRHRDVVLLHYEEITERQIGRAHV